jgi:tetratricopeptide (TPR) repeat protein
MPQRTLILATALFLFAAPATPQQPDPKSAHPKAVKDQGEADLFNAVSAERDQLRKLSLLKDWTARYPESDFRQERNLHFVSCYATLATNAVKPNAPADAIAEGERAAHSLLENSPTLFAPEMAPDNVRPEDWAIARQEANRQAHAVLAALATSRKDYPQAESELGRLLEMQPDDAATSYQLGVAIVGQQQSARYPAAIFYLAHAVALKGPGAFDGPTRQRAESFLETLYRNYHGDLTGLDEVKSAAVAGWAPPPGWSIRSVTEIAQEQIDADRDFAQKFPEIALWRTLRDKLTGPDGVAYFAAEMKGTEIPTLKGKIVEQKSPRELLVSIDGPDAEATLRLSAPLKTRRDPGTGIEFSGIPQSFTSQPFMLVLEVDPAKIK